MLNNFFISCFAIILGVVYGAFFYFGKKYAFARHKPFLNIFFTITRITLLFGVLYYMSTFIDPNPILMITLLVSSYLGTVAVLAYKS